MTRYGRHIRALLRRDSVQLVSESSLLAVRNAACLPHIMLGCDQ